MLKINDIITLKIEKSVYGGDGIGRIKAEGGKNFVIFVKNSVPEDILKIKITSINKTYAKGEILEIVKPSTHRTKALCPLYNACGSCQAQIYEYNFLIKQKQIVLKDIFKNIRTTIHPFKKSPKVFSYRHKVQYPARQTKKSKRILMGYFKANSHILTNIKFCPLQPDIIDEISQYIRKNWTLGCYNEKTCKGLLKNVIYRINSIQESILLTFVLNTTCNNFKEKEMLKFFNEIKTSYPIIKGTFVNFNPQKTNSILGKETKKILGSDFIIEYLDDKRYKIGATSFFQVNPDSAKELFDIVKNNVKENSNVLDAYGGVGAIGIYLKEKVKSITLVEENVEAVKLAEENFNLNKIKNFKILIGDAKKHFSDFQKQNKSFDCIILDPPRSGCDKEGLNYIKNLTDNIIYVSCNPNTLKRDVDFLIKENFELKSIQGVDMFPYTYHIEAVAILEKNNKNS